MDAAPDQIEQVRQKVLNSQIPPEIKEKLMNALRFPGSGVELEKLISYIDFVLTLPFGKYSQDILDLARAKQILDKNHHGLNSVKDRILEYLSVLILNQKKGLQTHAPVLAFIGLVGSGKTTMAYSIAESLGRKIIRIPFGGLGDATQLRGLSRRRTEAEAGQIMKAIQSAGVSNPVILLDEIDRVAEEGVVNIMGVLVELLDPAQNHAFVDYYLDFPYDLSKVLFVATANNTTHIATAVMDRLEPIQMPSYSDEEKTVIGRDYLLPKALQEAGLEKGQINISPDAWPLIIRPLGFDGGIRSLSRTLQAMVRKVARKTVEGGISNFEINNQNVGEYITNNG